MQKSYGFKKNSYKGNNEAAADLKPICRFQTMEEAGNQLSNFADKWRETYPMVAAVESGANHSDVFVCTGHPSRDLYDEHD